MLHILNKEECIVYILKGTISLILLRNDFPILILYFSIFLQTIVEQYRILLNIGYLFDELFHPFSKYDLILLTHFDSDESMSIASDTPSQVQLN
jgi:hypothetical protein